MPLTLQEARTIVDAGIAHARELNQRVAFAVVDEAGNVISLDRMDNVALHRDRFAIGKAVGAVVMRQPTAEAAKLRESGPDRYFGVLTLLPGQVYLVPGGVPIEVDGRIVGAVGVAGGTTGMDEKIAEAGLAAWRK
jgi:glc operon protein GlcG